MTADHDSESHELKSTSNTGADNSAYPNGVEEFQVPDTAGSSPGSNQIKGIKFILLIAALLSAVFCVALDNTSE